MPQPTRESPSLSDYAVALAAVAAAIALRALLTPLMGNGFPLATMFSAVAFSSWYSGWGPAFFTATVGFLAADAVFIPGSTLIGGRPIVPDVFSIGVYLLTCGSIIVLGESMRAAHRRLEAGQRALAAANLELARQVEAQALLAAVVASTGDAIVSATLDGSITSWNAGAQKLFGYTASEAIGRPTSMLMPPDRHGEARSILERIASGGRVELDTERITRSGERRDISLNISPVYDGAGLVIGASAVARDSTARMAAERRLQRSEEEQRLLVAIHDATRGLQNPSDVMLEVVTRVGLHFGVARCAYGEVDFETGTVLITRGYTDGVPTVAGRYPLGAFGGPMVAELEGGRPVIITDVRANPLTADPVAIRTYAQMQIVSLACVPLMRSGRLVAILVMCGTEPRAWFRHEADLLQRVAEQTLFAVDSARAAAALRENRDVLALAMGAGQMGAWSRDLVTDSVWWSRELEVLAGLPPGGFDGSHDGFYAIVHEDDRPAVVAAVEDALRSGTDYRVEFRFRHGSGEWRWMEGRGKATYGPDGTPRMLYGLGIDITERRRAVDALRDADRRKDEFLATLAHELRNPLAPITSGLHILRLTDGQGAEAAQARAIMERQVAQMVRLVDDLLDVARISTGKTELRREVIDVADAVRDAVETSRPLFEASEQTLEMTLPSSPVIVYADRTRLAQVFANLLNNSAKYSGHRQVIAIAVSGEGDHTVVRVRDAGIGMLPESLPDIFDMFRQGAMPSGGSQGGLGIGLFLVKRIVEMHGGSVEAHSDGPGRGSEFVIRLPVMRTPATHHGPPEPLTEATSCARLRVLVVDDNEDAAAMLAMMVAFGGHDTRQAHDGPEAMQLAADYRPDVVFLDIGLPSVDGYDTARWIRGQPWGAEMLIVALTGWGQAEDRRRTAEAGMDHHLVKPADADAIARLLASWHPANAASARAD